MSMPISLASNGILPMACVASQWNRAPCPWASLAASLTGLITPVSLFAAITETTLVSSVRASSRASRSIGPSLLTGIIFSVEPSSSRARHVWRTDLCSIAPTSILIGLPSPLLRPANARLFASVAPDVNMTSGALIPTACPTSLRAFSNRPPAALPVSWPTLDGFPNRWLNTGAIISTTRLSTGVVEL